MGTNPVQGQVTLAQWNFEASTTAPTTTAANVTAANASFGAGVGSVGFVGSAPNVAYTGNGWATTPALDVNDYIQVSVTPANGYKFNITAINFDERRSLTGIIRIAVRSSVDNFTSELITPIVVPDVDTYRNQNVPTSIQNQTSTVTFRIYGYQAEAATGTWRFDNITVTGTAELNTPVTGPALSANPVTISGLSNVQGTASASQSYTLTAQQLTAGITVTAPSNFEVSSDNITFSSTLNLAQSTTSATVFTRITSAAGQGAVSGTITNVSGAQSANVSVNGTVNAPAGTFTKISTIQGTGNTAAVTTAQTIEGVVVRAFPGTTGLSGFFVQEEDADQDGNPATSEGIFVFDPTGLFTGAVGDKVRVSGTPAEFTSTSDGVNSSLTQMATLTSVVNLGPTALPAVTTVTLPIAAPTGGVSALERFEGMLVRVVAGTGNLTVTEQFNLARFGQVTLAATDASNQAGTDPRIDQFTQFNAPSTTGFATYLEAAARRQIILDDGSSDQNPATIIHARGGNPLSASNTLRGGDDVTSVTGVLDERFDGYRIQTSTPVSFNAANPRPATIPAVGGTFKVGGANVLNYFNGPTFPTARGADTQTEFDRQQAKIVANLIGTGSDIVALSEIENDGYGSASAIQNLVNALNAVAGAGTYAFVNAGTTGTDEITVAMIYKPASVSLVGTAAVLSTGEFSVVGRGAVAQTFQQRTGGGIFTLVANHWKSKGSASAGAGNADANDGQGLSNGTRTRQAQELAAWLTTKPTGTQDPDYLIVGDLNAYAQEQPLTTLTTAGYSALLPSTSYSFAFRGDWGSLDHAFASTSLNSQVTGATKWYINSDEPRALDYNTEFKTAAQINSFYAADQYRSADHDPLVVGLNLSAPLPVRLVGFQATVTGDAVQLGWETSLELGADRFLVERSPDARAFEAVGQVAAIGDSQVKNAYGFTDAQPLPGTSYYRIKIIDRDGTTAFSKLVSATLDGVTPTVALLGNPVAGSTIRLAVRNMAGATYTLRAITGQTIPISIAQQTDRAVDLLLGQSVATGVYLLEAKTATTRQTLRVLLN